MRLMTAEKGAETPMEKYIRFKNDISLWYDEMKKEGITIEQVSVLEPYFKKSYGVPPSQEQMMQMLMDSEICNFSLGEANAARKIVGKKQMNKIPELKEKVLSQAATPTLGRYIWNFGIGPQMGYSFSIIHALAYSFIGYQTAYLATRWNPIYWDTACLIVNSGSIEEPEQEIVDIYETEDFENYNYIDLPNRKGKIKEKNSDYAKVAKAIGEITSKGINVSLININTSDYGFKPDIKNNRILYGLKPLSNINNEIIEKIKAGRPYLGIKDFMIRCPLSKTPMFNLIKAGAFDEVEKVLNNRKEIMAYYISQVCDSKKKLTLQNWNGLVNHNLIPKELELQIRTYNFTKYLKSSYKVSNYFLLNIEALKFINNFFSEAIDEIVSKDNNFYIEQKKWDKIYQKTMDAARDWLKENHNEILKEYNSLLFKECWNKYAKGTESAWEMDSLCFYHSDHELKYVDMNKYGLSNFSNLTSCEIERYYMKMGKKLPIYKLYRIAGTVLTKNDNKHTVSLLTTDGVVSVKFTRDHYAKYKQQISEVQNDGTKKVIETGWFKRGKKLIVTGFRRDDQFVVKTYANTASHSIYLIENINKNNELTLRHERINAAAASQEDYLAPAT